MMANSSRDPYWQASLRRETIDHASHSAAIQDECATCHMPMAQRTEQEARRQIDVFAQLPFATNTDSPLHDIAVDGISCTVCHQVASDKLGTADTFNGHFPMSPARPDGIRDIFGPFQIDPGRKTIMRSVTGFEQTTGTQVRQSELCATCHTLKTAAYDASGNVIGSLPEQMNYQEWQHSAFSTEQKSCQSCHMPTATGPIRVSSVLGDYRDALARHVFVGGNAFMVRMLNRYRVDLGVAAQSSELEATAKATLRQLAEDTATVTVTGARVSGASIAFDVDVRNLSGHKFPTGYPARRAWLHVTVRDQQGKAVFESGAVTAAGQIVNSRGDRDASTFDPHYDEITSAEQVQIYESIMGDAANTPTTGLLTATHYLKDNRLLPRGFDKASADADIAVHGDAMNDADFTGGGDRVRYRVNVPQGSGSFDIEVELEYQAIGYRWAHNLEKYDAAEPQRFVEYYNALSSASASSVAKAAAHVAPRGASRAAS